MNPDTTNPKDLIGILKPNLHLVPSALLIWTAKAMENGAAKYGPYNWREKKVRATIYISAALRHLYALLDGEDFAGDSGIHHAAHAAACLGILLDARECACLIDDRPPKGAATRLLSLLTTTSPSPTVSKKKKVYIAGPMRGIKNFNFPAFYAAEETLRAKGYEPFNPARRDTDKYGPDVSKSETGNIDDTKDTGFCIRDALNADCQWITRHADIICVLPGWDASKGAKAEVALGKALGLETIEYGTWRNI